MASASLVLGSKGKSKDVKRGWENAAAASYRCLAIWASPAAITWRRVRLGLLLRLFFRLDDDEYLFPHLVGATR